MVGHPERECLGDNRRADIGAKHGIFANMWGKPGSILSAKTEQGQALEDLAVDGIGQRRRDQLHAPELRTERPRRKSAAAHEALEVKAGDEASEREEDVVDLLAGH